MSLTMRWIGEADYDQLSLVRAQCYAPSPSEVEKYKERLLADRRGKPGDYLIAERDGVGVGTATALSMKMWIRGGCVPCQGVAYVGTIKTHRRGGSVASPGIASQIMFETLRKARERGEVVSALMPFRASFYSHFGYGLAERRTEWIVPLSILPKGDFDGIRFKAPADHLGIEACRQRQCRAGQCDIETIHDEWLRRWSISGSGMEIVDQSREGQITGWMYLIEEKTDGKTNMRVIDHGADSVEGFLRQLRFLGSLKDQYSSAAITLPGDVQLNRVLKEDQLPHRAVEHGVAALRPFTRMQIRVLDHKRLLEAMHLPPGTHGKATIAVRECEGALSKFRIDVTDGRIAVADSTDAPDLECSDMIWASIVSGDIRASDALKLGIIRVSNEGALRLFNSFSDGPLPFCNEYF